MRRRTRGFSLIELLVVIAIIGILFALQMPVFSKALRKAKTVATAESHHQSVIGRMADNANVARYRPGEMPSREDARAAFAQLVDTGKNEELVTEMLYVVKNSDEFRAYWHTLINPVNNAPLQYSSDRRSIIAKDPSGREFKLPVIDDHQSLVERYGAFPMAWDFISTEMKNMTSGNLGANVLYSDGSVRYVQYPGGFPMVSAVAELSNRYANGAT